LYECRADNKIYLKIPVSYGDEDYEAVLIGTQTWMARNLNYTTAIGSMCYGGIEDNCTTYGRIYNWSTAGTVCPSGWHLPNSNEWRQLMTLVDPTQMSGTEKLMSINWGDGTDYYGFSALPGGGAGSDGYSTNASKTGYWWSATRYDANAAYYLGIYNTSYGATWIINMNMDQRSFSSVRCIMND